MAETRQFTLEDVAANEQAIEAHQAAVEQGLVEPPDTIPPAYLVLADGRLYQRDGEAEDFSAVLQQLEGDFYGIPADPGLGEAPADGGEEAVAQHHDFVIEPRTPRHPFGDDDRLLVTAGQIDDFPYRSVGALTTSSASSAGHWCTGSLIGPRHVLTASHCVFNADGSLVNPDIYFWHGRNGEDTSYIPCLCEPCSGPPKMLLYYVRDWRVDWGYDYALLILQDRVNTACQGRFGWGYWEPYNHSNYDDTPVTQRGYPGGTCADSPLPDDRCAQYQYRQAPAQGCTLADSSLHRPLELLTLTCDTYNGQSGSSRTFAHETLGTISLGVLSHGSSSPHRHWATRIREGVSNDLCSWIGAHPSAYASHPCDP